MNDYLPSLVGGSLIGLASVGMLLFHGRILGISGIVGGFFTRGAAQGWRIGFLVGLISGGVLLRFVRPDCFEFSLSRSSAALVLAGLLVGYGTRLGSGCTSGHGVCGVSRLSPRSLIATATFMACGAATVFAIRHFFGGSV